MEHQVLKQSEVDNLEALYSISKIAAEVEDLSNLWGPLLDKVLEVLKVEAGTLLMLEGDYLVRKAAKGLGSDIMQEPPIHISAGGVSWGVVENRQPAIVIDLSKENIASESLAEQDFRSLVAVPLMVREQVIGVMSVFTRAKRQFSAEDLNFFSIVANQAALTIMSLRSSEILKENRKRLSELEALNQISKSTSTLFDFEETLYSIVASITKIFRGDSGLLALFDYKDHLLKAVGPAFSLSASQVRDFRLRNDEGIAGQAFCKGVPIMIGKIDDQTAEVLKRARISGIKSIMAAPLKVKSQTLGVIQVFSERENNFHFDDLRLFTILSSQVAVMVNSSSMYRQIEEERKKDEALLTSIADGVLAIDKNQKIIHFNKSGEKITGYLAEEILNESLADVLGLWDKKKEAIEAKDSPILKVLQSGKPFITKDYYFKTRSDVFFPVYLSAAAIYDADDKIIGAILVFRDITSEFELEQLKQELNSITTHELRAPITAIKGYLDMVIAGDTGGVQGETKETLKEVAEINQRLADLVDDLLNVSRIEQGRLSIKLQTMDLSNTIDQVVKEYTSQANDKNLKFWHKESSIPQVKGDPVRVHQVIVNLVTNAIKYTEKGSIEISAGTSGKDVICQVKDTGLGISKEAQKKLFEKFYRVQTPATRGITGTGLGLWITEKLLESMGGKIWLESVEGKGSTFYFSLPSA